MQYCNIAIFATLHEEHYIKAKIYKLYENYYLAIIVNTNIRDIVKSIISEVKNNEKGNNYIIKS